MFVRYPLEPPIPVKISYAQAVASAHCCPNNSFLAVGAMQSQAEAAAAAEVATMKQRLEAAEASMATFSRCVGVCCGANWRGSVGRQVPGLHMRITCYSSPEPWSFELRPNPC